jgi:hypothetical protein
METLVFWIAVAFIALTFAIILSSLWKSYLKYQMFLASPETYVQLERFAEVK